VERHDGASVGYITVEAVQFVTLGRRLREQTQTYPSITLLDCFASRFEDRRHLLRITGAVIIAIFTTAYVAAHGRATTVVWKLWLKEPTGLYELIPAFFGSLLPIVVVSSLRPATPADR
jgi:Na+/proline symporter